MFEQTFKNIDDILHKDAGCTSELDYTEQSSWLLFLKYLDALEADKASEAALEGKPYTYLIEPAYRWESWAAPKTPDGKLDHNAALTGDDLRDFVNGKLFPYLAGFKQRASGPNTIEYKIGEVFGEIKNKIQSGYNLRDVIEHVDELRFGAQAEKHELSHLYEAKIKNMGNAGRNGGEYYTPRPLIRAMIKVLKPKIGERIYDGACGSAGFLCEAFEYLSSQPGLTTADLKTLQTSTFYGKEKKSLAYVIAIMNMILHGIEAPNVIHANTLAENIADIQDKDRFDVILANPPFGGKERKEVQQNFPIKTGETAFLFLQHFIKMLKAGGRAAIVIKNTFLSNTDNASTSLRKLLLESCNLHTVLDLPAGTFQGASVSTVVLFFEKGAPTRKVWYYELDPGRTLGKTSPLSDADLIKFGEAQRDFALTEHSWTVDATSIDKTTWDLSVKNPNRLVAAPRRQPLEIMKRFSFLDEEDAATTSAIEQLLRQESASDASWTRAPLGELCTFQRGLTYSKSDEVDSSENVVLRATNVDLSTNLLDFSELRYISEKIVVPSNKLVRRDAILICTASGSKSHLGKVAYVDEDYGYAFGGFMGQIIAGPKVRARYLFYVMTSERYKAHISSLSDGMNINNLKFDDLRNFEVPFPSLEEQDRIVARLDAVSDLRLQLEELARERLNALEEFKMAMLDQELAGEF